MKGKYQLELKTTSIYFEPNLEGEALQVGVEVGKGNWGKEEKRFNVTGRSANSELSLDEVFTFNCSKIVDIRLRVYRLVDSHWMEIAYAATEYYPGEALHVGQEITSGAQVNLYHFNSETKEEDFVIGLTYYTRQLD